MANSNNTPKTQVKTKLVRFSYVHIFEPHAANENADKKYSMSVIIPKSDKETLAAIRAAIEAAKEQGKTSKWNGKIPANLKLPLRDGDEDRPDDEAYKNSYFFNCSSNNKPLICNRNPSEPVTEDDVYSGCYGRVVVNFYAFNQSGNKGIAAGLNAVQKIKDGERLGGSVVSADEFDDGFADEFDDDDDGCLD